LCVVPPEGGQTEKAEAGDEDRETGEDGGQVADVGLGEEFSLVAFVVEMIKEGAGWIELFVDGFYPGQSGADMCAGFDQDDMGVMAAIAHEDGGLDFVIGAVNNHILCHADDGIGFAPVFYGLTDGVFEPEDAGAFCFW
jgi:hypothetical protein